MFVKSFENTYIYKLACDGYDLLKTPIGQAVINNYGRKYVSNCCVMQEFPIKEDFIKDCIVDRQGRSLRGLSPYLCDKYEVGYFQTSVETVLDSKYILFNKKMLQFWKESGVDLFGLEFMVVPSRGWDGQINEIGFRLLNMERVNHAFKWLFPYGQRATFGLNLCSSEQSLLLCEGFLDMVAFRESGYTNSVGLGSAIVTEAHKQELKNDNCIMCNDMDTVGMAMRRNNPKSFCFYSPNGKDPYEVWMKYGVVKPVFVEGMEYAA